MKKLLIISLVLLFSAFLNAQNTLVFDRVEYKILNGTASSTCNVSVDIIIAAGEVGKVTAINGSPSTIWDILLDDVQMGGDGMSKFPIWLDSGTHEFKLCESASSGWVNFSISVLVFKVIPQ